MSKKVLVTGGAGYLGSWLVRQLLEKGYFVRCLDNLSYGDGAIRELYSNPNFEFLEGDICNIRDMAKALDGMPYVVALAAIVGDPACNLNEKETYSINYESTKVLSSLCEFYNVERLVFASSCSVYGASDDLTLNEGSLLNPISLYSRTRVMSEKILLENRKLNPVVLRFSTLYGQSNRMRYDLVVNFFSAMGSNDKKIVVHGGDQYRPIVHVVDAGRALVAALEAPIEKVKHEIFNVGSNEQNYTIEQIARMAKEVMPEMNVQISKDVVDRRNYKVSFDKISHLLNYRVTRSPQESIQEMIRHAQELKTGYKDPIYYNVQYLYKK